MKQEVHLSQEIRERLGFTPGDALFLQGAPVLHGLTLFFQMTEGFHQEAARAASGV